MNKKSRAVAGKTRDAAVNFDRYGVYSYRLFGSFDTYDVTFEYVCGLGYVFIFAPRLIKVKKHKFIVT